MKLVEITPDDNQFQQEWFQSEPILDPTASEQDRLLHEEKIDLWEMANLSSNITGIENFIIWINGGVEKLQHGPRIKVYRGNKIILGTSSTIPLSGMPYPRGNIKFSQDELAKIIEWIQINRSVLIAYGNNEMTTDELFQQLIKI